MESNSEASCISDPNFAVICAFLERFATSCGITYPPFLDLQEMLENVDEVPQELVDLHIILLRKAKRSVFREKWEKALVKFCHIYSTQDGWEIERFGYKNSRLEVKLRVLKTLLEGQFDLNCKFKTTINTLESTELRSKPVGKDKHGRTYWLQIDPTSNIRVYREDLDEESWTLVAKDRDSLVALLQELTVDEESGDVNLLNEDSSVSVDIEKTILDTGQEENLNGENDNFVTNGEPSFEEKDPLEIKISDNLTSDKVKNEESQINDTKDVGKRMNTDPDEDRDVKRIKVDEEVNGDEVGEAVEDPVMHVYGEGNGVGCDAGNPDKEDNKSDENKSSAAKQSEPVSSEQTNPELKKIETETKPQPKLWSIDTICGTGNFNHSGESSKSQKSMQKNFSSFSIESVLEKKTEVPHSSSPVPESPVISLNTFPVHNAQVNSTLADVNQSKDQINLIGNMNDSPVCNAISEDIPSVDGRKDEEKKTSEIINEICSVPIPEKGKNEEGSTVCVEKNSDDTEKSLTETEELDTVRGQDHSDECNDPEFGGANDKQGIDQPDNNTSNLSGGDESMREISEICDKNNSESSHLTDDHEVVNTDIKVENVSLVMGSDVNDSGNGVSLDIVKSEEQPAICEDVEVNRDECLVKDEVLDIPPKNCILQENGHNLEVKKEELNIDDTLLQNESENLHASPHNEKPTQYEPKREELTEKSDPSNYSVETEKASSQSEFLKNIQNLENIDEKEEEKTGEVINQITLEENTEKIDVGGALPQEKGLMEAIVVKENHHGLVEEPVTDGTGEKVPESADAVPPEKILEDSECTSSCEITNTDLVAEQISQKVEVESTDMKQDRIDVPAIKTFRKEEKMEVDECEENNNKEILVSTSDAVQNMESDKKGDTDADVSGKHLEEPQKIGDDLKNLYSTISVTRSEETPNIEHLSVTATFKKDVEENDTSLATESGDINVKVKEKTHEPAEVTDKTEIKETTGGRVKEEPGEIENSGIEQREEKPAELSSNEIMKDDAADDCHSRSEPSQTESGEVEESQETPSEEAKLQTAHVESMPTDTSVEEAKEETFEKGKIEEAEGDQAQEQKLGRKRSIETRRTSRSRKQSADEPEAGLPAMRTTRSAKKSIDEEPIIPKQVSPKVARGGKRKSQDSTDMVEAGDAPASTEEAQAVQESEEPEEAESVEDGKKTQKRRNSAVSSVCDKSDGTAQEENTEVVKKRKFKKRGKKKRSRMRKKTEQAHSNDEKAAEGGEAVTNENEEGEEKKKSQKSKTKEGGTKTRQLIPERELKLLGISNMEELPTVRQSRRIAQLKLKEEAERNRIKKLQEEAAKEEEEAKKKRKKKKKGQKSSTKKRKSGTAGDDSYEQDDDDDEDEEDAIKAKQEKRRKKKKDKLVFDEHNPWISSSGSSTADEEEEDIEDEAHEDEEILFKSDHEFSPESDIEDPDYKPIKRARTAKVDPKEATEADSKYDDTACEKCGEKDHPEWILLCDKCDKGWHASCVRPALMVVPEGDWFCPPCEHTALVLKLRESLVNYDKCQKQRENEELRKKRLAFVGISLDNVLPAKKDKKPKPADDNEGESEETASDNASDEESSSSGSSSSDSSSSGESSEPVYQLRERRSNITSYRYNEYDELIKSALQEEIEAVKGVGLGKGKDISNQAGAYEGGYEEDDDEEEEEEDKGMNKENYVVQPNDSDNLNTQPELVQPLNPHIPRDILQAKPRIKPKKKDEDQDYEVETDGEEEDEEYNQEENEEEDEEEELADEVPPVVPKYDKKKKKSRSLNVRGLDFTSDEEEEDNSDSDFKGESSEEESEFSLPSESESSDGVRRNRKNYDGPLRRSTRARTARYDKEFINDESEDEAPRRKKSRNVWIESESSDSDRSWGRRKKKGGRSSNRSTAPKRKSKSKGGGKKKNKKKRVIDSENDDETVTKKPRSRKIKYGGLDDLDEEQVLTRRTRGKKINYQEMNASDSDDEVTKRRPRVIGESDEEFVAEKEKSDESEGEDDELLSKREANGKAVSKKSIMRKMKKKRKVIPDPDDFSEDDLLEDEELDQFAEELQNLNEEEENMLEKMLRDGDVPIPELKDALKKLKERRNAPEVGKPYPSIPEHVGNPGLDPRFPKVGKVKLTPSRSELAAQLSMNPEMVVANMRGTSNVLLGNLPKEAHPINLPEGITTEQPGNIILMNEQKTESKEALLNLQPPPYPFPPETSPGIPPQLVNPQPHQFPVNNRAPMPPFNSFQGIINQPPRLPPDYPHANIPTTVLGIESEALRNQGRKPSIKTTKRKNEDGSPQGESGEENSGDGRLGDGMDSSPKRRGRGRGKKQIMAEVQAKQELGISTVQAPTQFPPQGLPPDGGSVITRMLNTPQGPQPFSEFPVPNRGRPPFRPPYPNALRPPLNPPSPSRLRAPGPGIFHASLPLDPTSSAINLPQTKPSSIPPGFPPRGPILPRYPTDPNIRPPFPAQSSPPRNENYAYPNFYGQYPPIPNSEDAPFHNPNFPNHPFDEQHPTPIDGASSSSKGYEDEVGGEFGGLASYFASQREDDLDT